LASSCLIGTPFLDVTHAPADYNSRPTDYNSSQPGLGSVFRAARAYFHYTNNA